MARGPTNNSHILLKRQFRTFHLHVLRDEQKDKRTNSGNTEAVPQKSMTLSSMPLPNRQTDRLTLPE